MLPRLIGSREAVRELLAGTPLAGKVVVLNARELRSASPSAADEFVKFALVEGRAETLEVIAAAPHFCRDLEASSRARGVEARLKELSAP